MIARASWSIAFQIAGSVYIRYSSFQIGITSKCMLCLLRLYRTSEPGLKSTMRRPVPSSISPLQDTAYGHGMWWPDRTDPEGNQIRIAGSGEENSALALQSWSCSITFLGSTWCLYSTEWFYHGWIWRFWTRTHTNHLCHAVPAASFKVFLAARYLARWSSGLRAAANSFQDMPQKSERRTNRDPRPPRPRPPHLEFVFGELSIFFLCFLKICLTLPKHLQFRRFVTMAFTIEGWQMLTITFRPWLELCSSITSMPSLPAARKFGSQGGSRIHAETSPWQIQVSGF